MEVRIDTKTDALLVVDTQPTFMPGGGLAVAGGNEIMLVVMKLMSQFPLYRRFATKDRHPRGHISLASSYVGLETMTMLTPEMVMSWINNGMACEKISSHALFTPDDLIVYLEAVGFQVLWPDHAIEGTAEAELHWMLQGGNFAHVQVKGMDPKCDSYSGFFDNLRRSTGLADVLRSYGVRRVICCGLAYDYCVGWTAANAVAEGFEAVVVMDATRSVGYPADSVIKMTDSLKSKGVLLVDSTDLRF